MQKLRKFGKIIVQIQTFDFKFNFNDRQVKEKQKQNHLAFNQFWEDLIDIFVYNFKSHIGS